MDEWVRQKLRAWNMTRWLDNFVEEEVDELAFKNLRDDSIKQLIPKIGPQIHFLLKWTAENQAGWEDSKDWLHKDGTTFQELPIIAVPSSSISDIDTLNIPIANDEANNSSSEQNVVFNGNVESDFHLCKPIENLEDVLKNSVRGFVALTYYNRYHKLDESHRTFIVDTILDIELRTNIEMKIEPSRFIKLTKLITKLFPTEAEFTYYVPYNKDASGRRHLAKGKFHDKYHYFRGLLLNADAIVNSRGQRKRRMDMLTPIDWLR